MLWSKLKPAPKAANPRRDTRFHSHRDHFRRFVDFSKTSGFEIGAFDLPMVEPNEGLCVFGDYRTKEELQALAANAPGHNPDFVQQVDYDLRNGYDQIDGPFDWIAAAHVIEHIPDVIGWIKSLDRLLKPGGRLLLIIPDKRYTFDHHRRVSTVTDFVTTHRQQLTRPSYGQVFDHIYYATTVPDPEFLWRGADIPAPPRNFATAHTEATRTESEYVDCHCSVFTPESFMSCFFHLAAAGTVPLEVGEIVSTQRGHPDFSAILFKR